MSDEVLAVRQVARVFGRTVALADVTLSVARGTVFGLVGENGAGKTTLIKHLLGLHRPERGQVRVFGLDPVRDPVGVLSRIGYLSEDRDLPEWMRVGELMSYTRAFYPQWDDDLARELIEMFELDIGQKIRTLSRGQRARAGLLAAVAHRPDLVLLDEPSSGLDPGARQDSGARRAHGGRRGPDSAAVLAPAARGPAGRGPRSHATSRGGRAERTVGRLARSPPLADGALRYCFGVAAAVAGRAVVDRPGRRMDLPVRRPVAGVPAGCGCGGGCDRGRASAFFGGNLLGPHEKPNGREQPAMMIRSLGYALSWEYWRRGMFWFVPSALAPTIVCLLLVAVPRVPISGFWLDVGARLRPALVPFILLMPVVLALASWVALRRHYAMPVSTMKLVAWSLANGALAAAGTYCCTALALNAVLHADWPLTIPALCSATACVAFQAALWWLGPSRGLLGVLAAVGWASLAVAAKLYTGRIPFFERLQLPQEWSQVSLMLVAACLGVVALSYLVAVNGVARDRRGEAWSLSWLSRGWAAALDVAWQRSRGRGDAARFRSAASAQFWYEWRTKGRHVPLTAAGMLGGLWLCFVLVGLPAVDVTTTMASFSALFLVASPLVGLFLGSRRRGFDLTSFTATRPLPDSVLAATVLRCTAASVCCGWAIWLLGWAAARAVWAPEHWQPLSSLWKNGLAELIREYCWGASLFCLTCWTFVGWGASLALSRRWFVSCTSLVLTGLLLSLVLAAGFAHLFAEAVIVLVAEACLICTIAAFLAARRRKLLSGRAALAYLAGYLILLIYFYGASPEVDESAVTHALRIGFAAAPFAPFAAAPLALSWNRHR